MENKIGVYFTENEISSVIKALNSCPGNEKEVESNFILASDLKKILHSHKENSIQNPFKDTPETSSFMKKMEIDIVESQEIVKTEIIIKS